MTKLMCKVKPDYNTCCSCQDNQIDAGVFKSCGDCDLVMKYCEIVHLGVDFFGRPYAIILKDRKLEKVSIKRVYDVGHGILG